jgi:hypothetical protein
MRGVLWDLTDTERLRALASAGSSVSEIDLSTHLAGALYDAFPAPEARRVMKRLQFHHNRKHANWLNMVEMEIGVLPSQCLDRRIDDKETILAEVPLGKAAVSDGLAVSHDSAERC